MNTASFKVTLASCLILVIRDTQAALTDGLTAHYELNGNAADSSGGASHGTVKGATPSSDRFGTPNGAYFFDGIDDYILIPESAAFDSRAFTISLWFRSASFPREAGMLMSKGQNNFEIHTTQEEFIAPRALKFLPRFVAHGVAMDWNTAADMNALHKWTHVVGVYNPGTEISFYVDGVEATLSGPSELRDAPDNRLDARLGMRTDNSLPFHGEIDDVRIYDRPLPAEEISQLFSFKVERLIAPDEETQTATIDLVQEIYKEDFERALIEEQKIVLAKKLLQESLNTTDDDTGRFVLLELACSLAAENGDMETALKSVEQMDQIYEIDRLAVMVTTFDALAISLRTRPQNRILAMKLTSLVDDAINSDRYELANKFAELGLGSARKSKDFALSRQALAQRNDVDALSSKYAKLQEARVTLEKTPADPVANLSVGKFYCFTKGDWTTGLPMLALSNDPGLKELAGVDLAMPNQPNDQVDLGDGWWEQASKADSHQKQNFESRAKHWYLQALPNLSGLTAARIRKRLDSLNQPVAP